MKRRTDIGLNDQQIIALRYIDQYRYLTPKHVAVVTGKTEKASREMLLRLHQRRLLGYFGNEGITGGGKMPKCYVLTRHGHRVLVDESEAMGNPVRPFREYRGRPRWTASMRHQHETINIMMSVERSVALLPNYELVETFVEHRKRKEGSGWIAETADYVDGRKRNIDKIIPDAAFILRNHTTQKIGLFFVECDRGTVPVKRDGATPYNQDICYKITKYERYLESGLFRERYRTYGNLGAFRLLFVTTSGERIRNIQRALVGALTEIERHVRFSTLSEVQANFFHDCWFGADGTEGKQFRLIKG